MPIHPDEFLTFAENTLISDQEISRRVSASRAYYYIYHVLLVYARDHPGITILKNTGFHQSLINAYSVYGETKQNSDSDAATELARLLSRARAYRTNADYKLSNHFHQDDIHSIFLIVKRVQALLESKAK